MAWIYLLVAVVSLVVGTSLVPRPQARPPAGLNEFNFPTAEDGREIPVLFGTRELEAPNIVWYGDFRAVAVKKQGGKK